MALKNQPEFEQPTTETTTKETTVTETVLDSKTDQAAAAGVSATTAIAKASTTSVGAVAKKFTASFAASKDVFDTPTVSALSRATPRITAEQGELVKNRGESLGKSITIEIISWNDRLAIGCGEDNQTDEMKALFKVSYDGKTLDGDEGTTVAAYIESLKAEGYAKAKSSPYVDIFGYIIKTDKGEIPVEDRELVLVQASQTSAGNFKAFCVSRGLLESRGNLAPCEFVEITAVAQQSGTKRYTNMQFKAAK